MRYLDKTYYHFLHPQQQSMVNEDNNINKTRWVAEKVECLRKKMARIKQELSTTYDPKIQKRLQLELKVCELKILIAGIK